MTGFTFPGMIELPGWRAGRLISASPADVGGYRLHIQCVGTGSPTVVLDAGLSGSSLDWSLVQPELGRTTRVCTATANRSRSAGSARS